MVGWVHDMSTIEAKHIVVHGMVQGVGFRYFVQRLGTRLALTGSVRNCPDSTVEICAEGDRQKIAEFLAEVRRGPRLAEVTRLDIEDVVPHGKYRTFVIEGW
jgi:acylphosphatase